MNDFVTWDIIGTYAGAVMVVGLITQLLKYFPLVEKLPTQLLSYLLSFIILTASQLALNTFSLASLGLNIINAVIVSLASNGAYTAMSNIIANQEARIEKETMLEEDNSADKEEGESVPPII
jgi:hypothetical protein